MALLTCARSLGVGLVVAGCGAGWVDVDPAAGLPTSGAGPYVRPTSLDTTPVVEPWLFYDLRTDLADPSVLADDLGLHVWMSVTPEGQSPAIGYGLVTDATVAQPVPPIVLRGDLPWEAGTVRRPSVFHDATGYHMLYEAGADGATALGLATSVDGVTWAKQPQPIATGAAHPSWVTLDDRVLVFATRDLGPGLWRGELADDRASVTWDAAPILEARPGLEDAFDANTVGEPAALTYLQPSGRPIVHLWFTGTSGDDNEFASIGYAASRDGVTFTRPSSPDAIISADARAAAIALRDTAGILLFTDVYRGRDAIGYALHGDSWFESE